MCEEEQNQSQASQEDGQGEINIPDIDTNTYIERGLNSDDLIEK